MQSLLPQGLLFPLNDAGTARTATPDLADQADLLSKEWEMISKVHILLRLLGLTFEGPDFRMSLWGFQVSFTNAHHTLDFTTSSQGL